MGKMTLCRKSLAGLLNAVEQMVELLQACGKVLRIQFQLFAHLLPVLERLFAVWQAGSSARPGIVKQPDCPRRVGRVEGANRLFIVGTPE